MHGRCILTRTSKESKASNRRGQGRPLGMMVAWLAENHHISHTEHMQHKPTLETRAFLRHQYRDEALFCHLECLERGKRSGEGSEPEDAP